jgi:hypothetical protein
MEEEIRRQANRLARYVPCAGRPDDRDLVAKVAILHATGALSDDDLEQALESFENKPPRDAPGGWLFTVLENRIGSARQWRRMLAQTVVPQFLERTDTHGQD